MAARLKNNKSRVNLKPRSAHGRAVNKNKSRVNLEPRSAHGRAVNKSRVDYEPRSAHGHADNKKLFRAYNRAFTKNNEAGLERNRFYFCRCVVARK